MGALASRHSAGVEEVDISSANAYRYPPKSGCYFGSHFFMGGQRFDTMQPEAYLFGPNSDLNLLGNRPIPFPYPAPQPNEPTKTLKSLVNIRKDSLRFVKVPEDLLEEKKKREEAKQDEENKSQENQDEESPQVENKEEDTGQTEKRMRYNVEFTFDTDVRCAITIHYFATEEISGGQAIYRPRMESMNSETYHYKRGANQVFSQSTHILEPSQFPEEEWQYNPDKEQIPIVIQCVVEEEEHIGHSHMTFATVDHAVDGGWQIKPLKQKQMVDGLCYLLQEIYGIENKTSAAPKDEDIDDSGAECIVCMSDIRDTLILPCRHLCLCNNCADSLRYQANNCPICRKTFHALLQIRALRKKPHGAHQTAGNENEDNGINQEGVPPGYEAVALLDALNGPNNPVPVHSVIMGMGPDGLASRPNQLSSDEENSSLKKTKRHGSTKSTKSKDLSPTSPSDGEVPAGEDGSSTPKMAINREIPEPVKVTETQAKATSGGPDAEVEKLTATKDSVEVVNEVDVVKTGKVSQDRSVTPPPDYADVEGAVATSTHSPKPAAHATVMYDRPEDRTEEERQENQPLVSLPSQVVEGDQADSSGSSYSSTSSNKILLSRSNSPSKMVV